MKSLVIAFVLSAGLGMLSYAQAPAKLSLAITADTIGKDAEGRAVFSGAVVIVIDGTQITADSGAVYDMMAKEIALSDGKVKIKLGSSPWEMNFQARHGR